MSSCLRTIKGLALYKDRKIIGIIPARGGSKGLPRKNVLPLLGKPLIAWTIEKAISSNLLDRVIVSTDDEEIAGISKEHGADVPFSRPKELAQDKTSMMDVVFHTIDYFNSKKVSFDYIALLEPTSPLRKEDDIDRAIKELIDNEIEADSLVSLGEVHMEHPSIVKRVSGRYVEPYETVSENVYRRQDLEKVFFPYGVIYLSKT
ncbi:MAG: acylneuraminate cytidylyltransferase family protein, partial [Thermodesulfobacteriota bacterium]